MIEAVYLSDLAGFGSRYRRYRLRVMALRAANFVR